MKKTCLLKWTHSNNFTFSRKIDLMEMILKSASINTFQNI
jgi:hypothetical protein